MCHDKLGIGFHKLDARSKPHAKQQSSSVCPGSDLERRFACVTFFHHSIPILAPCRDCLQEAMEVCNRLIVVWTQRTGLCSYSDAGKCQYEKSNT